MTTEPYVPLLVRTAMRFALLLPFAFSSSSFAQVAAPSAPPAAAPPPPSAPVATEARGAAPEPNNVDGTQTYTWRVQHALGRIVVRDFDGAIAALKQAASDEPAQPWAFCALGDAQLGKGDFDQARVAYEACETLANVAREPLAQNRALMGLARTAERAGTALRDVREIWLRTQSTTRDSRVAHTAREQVAAIDDRLALEAEYADVQRRIKEREKTANVP